jgi:ATP-dependent RNA helicase RhlE
MLFEDLNLIAPLLSALKKTGYTEPTPIQAQSIPIVLEKKDLLACAQTGTGKTAAFALPIIQLLETEKKENNDKRRKIRALILTPTRELAIQIYDQISIYGKECNLRHTVIFGGVGQQPQVQNLKNGVDILVATPGRLLDLHNQMHLDLRFLEIFVLDEADRMLDMGFIHDIKKLLKIIPTNRQSLFFSATMPNSILDLANSILTDPLNISVTPVSSTAELIQQKLYYVDTDQKRDLLLHLLENELKGRVLIFTRTKYGADKLCKFLIQNSVKAEAIHGNKSQQARQNALSGFKNNKLRILVATDIAARGIDVEELEYVINFEIPNVPETYVHRIGRSGRAGVEGTAISFCDESERPYIFDIQKLINLEIPFIEEHPYPTSRAVNREPIKLTRESKYVNLQHKQNNQQNANKKSSKKRYFRKPS